MIWCILFRKRFAKRPDRRAGGRRIGTTGLSWPSAPPCDILLSRRRMMPFGTPDMDKFTTITVEARGAIEILSLNRPEALNAVTPAIADGLIAYFSRLHDRFTSRIMISPRTLRASRSTPS